MRRLAGLGILLIAVTWFPHAFADPGGTTDPTGDAPAPSLDLVNVTHTDSSSSITFTATLAGDPTASPPPEAIAWALNTDADGNPEFCAGFQFNSPSIGQAAVLREPCTLDISNFVTSANASRSGNTFTLSFSRSFLGSISSYTYTVIVQEAFDPNGAADDTAGPVTHTLTAAATSTPTTTDTPRPTDTDRPGADGDSDDNSPLAGRPGASIGLQDSTGQLTTQFFAGETGTAVGVGLRRNGDYDVLFGQSPDVKIGAGGADRTGVLQAPFRIPTNARLGPARITIKRGALDTTVIPIQIVSSRAAAAGGARLPATGGPIERYMRTGSLLVLAGMVLMGVSHTRRKPVLVPQPVEGISDILFNPDGKPFFSGG